MRGWVSTGVFLLLAMPGLLVGQGGDLLDRVEVLLDHGRIEEARETLLSWWDTALPGASRTDRQRGLWLRGQLTVDPAMAELDFRRLVLEYPGGAFTDRALFRLALWAEARGDTEEALSHLRALARDHPASVLLPQAEERLGKGTPPPPPLVPSPSTGTRAPPKPILEAGERPFAVQVGAFRNLEGARALARRLREAGYEPRLVRIPGSDLLRVRVGRFAQREEGVGVMRELRGRGFDATLATDAFAEMEVV